MIPALLKTAIATENRAKAFALEHAMLELPQLDIPVKHYFSEGVYAREMLVPEGACVVGKIHKYKNFNMLGAGEIGVLLEDGMRRLRGPFSFVAEPGAKRAFYAITEFTWTVVHGTQLTDLEEIESYFIAQSEEEFMEFLAEQKGRVEL